MDTRARTIGTITKYPLGHSPYRTLQEPRRGSTYVRSTLHHVSSFAFITWSLTVVQQVCAALSCSEKQCLFGFSMCCVVLCLSLLSKVSSHWQKWMNESFGMKNKPTTRRSWQSLWTDHLRLLNPFTSHESKHWFASETMMSRGEKNEIGPTEEFAAKIRTRLDWDGVEGEVEIDTDHRVQPLDYCANAFSCVSWFFIVHMCSWRLAYLNYSSRDMRLVGFIHHNSGESS